MEGYAGTIPTCRWQNPKARVRVRISHPRAKAEETHMIIIGRCSGDVLVSQEKGATPDCFADNLQVGSVDVKLLEALSLAFPTFNTRERSMQES